MKTTKFKDIHIGTLIKIRMQECNVSIERAALFLKMDEDDIELFFEQQSINTELLLRWSKLLEYDFFRIYTQHLILFSPQDPNKKKRKENLEETKLPIFKKNIYTQEVIEYLVDLVESGKKTFRDIQDEYNVPSTTVFRWSNKYGKNKK